MQLVIRSFRCSVLHCRDALLLAAHQCNPFLAAVHHTLLCAMECNGKAHQNTFGQKAFCIYICTSITRFCIYYGICVQWCAVRYLIGFCTETFLSDHSSNPNSWPPNIFLAPKYCTDPTMFTFAPLCHSSSASFVVNNQKSHKYIKIETIDILVSQVVKKPTMLFSSTAKN